MSRIRADRFVNNAATGAPQLTYGAEVVAGVGITGAGGIDITGIVTATSFSGDGSSLTGVASTENIITGTAATFTGSVNITGITTVGVLTAYTSIKVGTAITMDATSGIVTATSFSGDGGNLSNVGLAASTVTLQTWLFGGG